MDNYMKSIVIEYGDLCERYGVLKSNRCEAERNYKLAVEENLPESIINDWREMRNFWAVQSEWIYDKIEEIERILGIK